MQYHWLLPPPGTVKVNVHGATPFIPFSNGNTNGIGLIIRNSDGEMLKLSIGVFLNLTSLQNQLWVINRGLTHVFENNHKDVILETDNWEVFNVLRNFPYNVPVEAIEPSIQIVIRLHDLRWVCSIVYVFPDMNQLAIYLARLGGDKCDHLYTFSKPIERVEELLSLDLWFSPLNPQFHDIKIDNDESEPMNFGISSVDDVINGGYAFHEDFFKIHNETMNAATEMVNVHNVLQKDFIFGNGYATGFARDHPVNVMFT